MEKEMKLILFTNLDYVRLNGVRTNCHALLLYNDPIMPAIFGTKAKIRGFGTEAAWPVFDVFVDSIEYEMVSAASSAVFLGESGKLRPLISGVILKMKDGLELSLCACNQQHPIDIQKFQEGTDINIVWEMLSKKVAKYWTAPNMPSLYWKTPF